MPRCPRCCASVVGRVWRTRQPSVDGRFRPDRSDVNSRRRGSATARTETIRVANRSRSRTEPRSGVRDHRSDVNSRRTGGASNSGRKRLRCYLVPWRRGLAGSWSLHTVAAFLRRRGCGHARVASMPSSSRVVRRQDSKPLAGLHRSVANPGRTDTKCTVGVVADGAAR